MPQEGALEKEKRQREKKKIVNISSVNCGKKRGLYYKVQRKAIWGYTDTNLQEEEYENRFISKQIISNEL